MALKIEVRREVMFAPARHVTLWTLNPTYTSASGHGMIMTVTETDGHGLGATATSDTTSTAKRASSCSWWPRNRESPGTTTGPTAFDSASS